MRDLGLTYEQAAHGIQTSVKFEMEQRGFPATTGGEVGAIINMMKHLRVGLDMRAADAGALAALLIQKGVFTQAEYLEMIRLMANEELARYSEHCRKTYGLPDTVNFR